MIRKSLGKEDQVGETPTTACHGQRRPRMDTEPLQYAYETGPGTYGPDRTSFRPGTLPGFGIGNLPG